MSLLGKCLRGLGHKKGGSREPGVTRPPGFRREETRENVCVSLEKEVVEGTGEGQEGRKIKNKESQ